MNFPLAGALCVPFLVAAACAGATPAPDATPRSSADAGPVEAAAPVERPFASTPLEAQTMIQAQIEARSKALWRCVEELRKKVGDPHRAVTVNIGIDQEGHLIGVAAPDVKHGDLDPALKTCMTDVLRGAMFPRSHTGVITVKQVFQDSTL